MNDSENSSPLPELPSWLWIVLAPVIFLAIPLIAWGTLLILLVMKLFGASESTREKAFEYAGIIIVPPFAILFLIAGFGSAFGIPSGSQTPGSGGFRTGQSGSFFTESKPSQSPISDDVTVRGHFRSDGSYVDSHFRTRANHTDLDNYSTYPNINPYTGARGSKQATNTSDATDPSRSAKTVGRSNSTSKQPPVASYQSEQAKSRESVASTVSGTDQDRRRRERKADALANLGVSFSPDDYSWSELNDFERRIRKAKEVKKLGVEIDWRENTWSELYDVEQRVSKTKQIEKLEVTLDWRSHTWTELSDIEHRITKAKQIAKLGIDLNWRDHTWSQLSDALLRIRKTQELERLGVTAEWDEYSWLELSDMCRQARKNKRESKNER